MAAVNKLVATAFLLAAVFSLSARGNNAQRSFTIDYKGSTFLKDGRPFRYISGSIDYQRVPYQYWEDRLHRLWAGGFNAVQLYVPWSLHEPLPGVYDFGGQQNLTYILDLATKFDLIVLLRPGPFTADEMDYGGLPGWLLTIDPHIKVRTSDPNYIAAVDRYFSVLFKIIRPYLYANGGPIATVQIENEYGSYFACDYEYMNWLMRKARTMLGEDIVLTTIDGDNIRLVKCGNVKGLYATLDFRMSLTPEKNFEVQKLWEDGPLVNNEYYTGWFDHWGEPHNVAKASDIAKGIELILQLGANIDLDMFEGGTSFGFMAGAHSPPFRACLTSYDYDSPLSEAGDIRPKYMDIRNVISKFRDVPPAMFIPPDTPKCSYGKVAMKFITTVQSHVEESTPVKSQFPLTMEQVKHYYGFILYRHTLTETVTGLPLDLSGVRDRAFISINQVPVAVVQREKKTTVMISGKNGETLDILVENQGRVGYGTEMLNNTKGLVSNVTLGGKVIQDWLIWPVNLQSLPDGTSPRPVWSELKTGTPVNLTTPSFYSGVFNIPETADYPADTYLEMMGWSKGQAFINGFNLGRYWPVRGPQMRLYVPKFALKQGKNVIVMLELEKAPCLTAGNCYVSFFDQPWINGTIHPDVNSEIHVDYVKDDFKFMGDF